MKSNIELVFSEYVSIRLDHYLKEKLPEFSKTDIQKMIQNQLVSVNNNYVKNGYKLREGDVVHYQLPPPKTDRKLKPQAMDLDIIFEDEYLIIVNKSAGVIVHPGAGQHESTLVNGLLHHCDNLSSGVDGARPGIVHRLDKGTSGVMVVTKTNSAHQQIAEQFQNRIVEKVYVGFTWGEWKKKEGVIKNNISRNRKDPTSFMVSEKGRYSETKYKVTHAFRHIQVVEFYPKTGRTHQIRVHANTMGYPIVGDSKYNGGLNRVKGFMPDVKRDFTLMLKKLNRHALHAKCLSFYHPKTGENVSFSAELPKDMKMVFNFLQEEYA